MTERVAPGDYKRLHHFVSDGVSDEAPLGFDRPGQHPDKGLSDRGDG
jgi:hypothetical protein